MLRVILALALCAVGLANVGPAAADTTYNIYGTGRTYRNNLTYSCVYWGYLPGQSYCYLGVWADTQYLLNNVVEVVEWAENLGQVCQGSPPFQVCSTQYVPMVPDPLTVVAQSIATTNGVHYDSDSWPSTTRGYAGHRNYTYSSTERWWTSDGY